MNSILNTLLEITLYSVALYAAILIFKRIFSKHISVFLNYAVWALLVLRLILPVTFESGLHIFTIPNGATAITQNSADTIQTQNIKPVENTLPVSQVKSEPSLSADTTVPAANPQTSVSSAAPRIDWQALLVCLWLFGVLANVAYMAALRLRLERNIRQNGFPATKNVTRLFETIKTQLNIKRDLNVLMQKGMTSPALSASFKPKLLIPQDMAYRPGIELEFGIRHELTHFKRKDHLTSLLLMLIRSVYWFNPIVWIACRQIETDMETLCDTLVTHGMENSKRLRYIRMVIELGGNTGAQAMVGMSASLHKRTMEKRIRGIFMKKKTSLSLKAFSAFLALLLFAACFTTACQPTPEKPVVMNKNAAPLEEKIKQSDLPKAKFEAPQSVKQSFQKEGAKIAVYLDAAVQIPDTDAYPVMKIKPATFSQEQADKMVQVFFQGKPLYNQSRPRTKSELQAELVELKADLAEKKKNPDKFDNSVQDFEEVIKNTEDAISTAPEKVADTKGSTQLTANEYGEIRLDLKADLGKKQNATLWLMNKTDVPDTLQCFARFINTDSNGGFDRFDDWNVEGDTPTALKISRDDAVKKAKDLLNSLSIENMDVACIAPGIIGDSDLAADVSHNPQCYMIYFTRTVDNIPTTFERIDGAGSNISADQLKAGDYPADYRPPWNYERILVCVDDTGIAEFKWDSPVQLLGKTTESADLMPFDQILKTFGEQMFIKYSYFENDNGLAKKTYYVDKITLGLTRVACKNNLDEYLLIPVWDFFGSSQDSYNIDTLMEEFQKNYEQNHDSGKKDLAEIRKNYEEKNNKIYKAPNESFLTINALDGSVINRNLGY